MTITLVVCGVLSVLAFLFGAVMVADDENHLAAGGFAVGLWIMWIGLMLK